MKTRLLVFPGKGDSPVSGSLTSPSGETVARRIGSSWLYSTLMISEDLGLLRHPKSSARRAARGGVCGSGRYSEMVEKCGRRGGRARSEGRGRLSSL